MEVSDQRLIENTELLEAILLILIEFESQLPIELIDKIRELDELFSDT